MNTGFLIGVMLTKDKSPKEQLIIITTIGILLLIMFGLVKVWDYVKRSK